MHVHFCLPRYIFCLFLYLSMYTYLCTLFCLILYLLLFYLHRFYLFLSRIRSSDVGRALIVRSVKHTKSCRHSSQCHLASLYLSHAHTHAKAHTFSQKQCDQIGRFSNDYGGKILYQKLPKYLGTFGSF